MTRPHRTASQALYDLGLSFPSLVEVLEACGRDGDTVQALADYVRSPAACSGGTAAARFLLELYNPVLGRRHPELAFGLTEALGCWDHHHLAAFSRWAQEPYSL